MEPSVSRPGSRKIKWKLKKTSNPVPVGPPSPVPHPTTHGRIWELGRLAETDHAQGVRPATLGIGGWEAPPLPTLTRGIGKRSRASSRPPGGGPLLSPRAGGCPQTTPPRGNDFFAGPKTVPPPLRGGRVVDVEEVVHAEELNHSPPRQGPCSPAGRGPGHSVRIPGPPPPRLPGPPPPGLPAGTFWNPMKHVF